MVKCQSKTTKKHIHGETEAAGRLVAQSGVFCIMIV